MQVGHPADGIPIDVIQLANRPVTAVDVRQNSPARSRRAGRREGFNPIAQNKHNAAVQPVESLGDAGNAPRQCHRIVAGTGRPGLHSHRGIHMPAGLTDLVNGSAKPGQQVHSGHDQSRLKARVPPHRPQDGFKQAKLRPRPSHDADAEPL